MANQERKPFVLDFPDGQRVEDILKKADALPTKAQLDNQLAGKASMSDVQRETQNLQNQINEIVRAPESGGDVAAEVYQARVGADGTNYSTLKERLDTEYDHLAATADFVEIAWTTGGYINSLTGTVVPDEAYAYTDFIKISPGFIPIAYQLRVFQNIATYALYDENQHLIFIAKSSSSTLEDVSGTITQADVGSAVYIRFCSRLGYGTVRYTNISDFVLALDSIESGNIKSKAISAGQLADDVAIHDPASDLINHAKVKPGYYVYSDGSIRTSTNVNVTDFIPMSSSVTYYQKNLYYSYYAFYDSSKNLIASYGTLGNLESSFTPPAGTAYGRFTVLDSQYSSGNYWISNHQGTPVSYRNLAVLPVTTYKDSSIDSKAVKPHSLSADCMDFIAHDPDTNYISGWIKDAYIRNGVLTPHTGFYASEPIYLEQNTSYYWYSLYKGHWAVYDADAVPIETHSLNDPIPNPYTLPQNGVYIRATCISQAQTQDAWIYTSNSAPLPYSLMFIGNIKLPSEMNPYSVANPCDCAADDICTFTKCLCIGDSLTAGTFNHRNSGTSQYIAYDKYSFPAALSRMTNLETTNKGLGGYTSGEWYDSQRNVDLSGHDLAIIQLGVNDNIRRQQLDMTIAEWFADTTRCKFADIISKLKTENKNIKIFVANIIPARSYHNQSYLDFSDYLLQWLETTYSSDPDVIPVDIMQYGHTYDLEAYNCGHLSAYGYWRLALDYKNFISYYMHTHPNVFKEVQFIGTDYWYDDPNA